jgi:hypothetical protein
MEILERIIQTPLDKCMKMCYTGRVEDWLMSKEQTIQRLEGRYDHLRFEVVEDRDGYYVIPRVNRGRSGEGVGSAFLLDDPDLHPRLRFVDEQAQQALAPMFHYCSSCGTAHERARLCGI